MQTKILEIRDEATMILVLCVDMNLEMGDPPFVERALEREGYPCDGTPNILMTRLSGHGTATNDPYGWPGSARTFQVAHDFIINNWASIKEGDVIDVEFILGEKPTKKTSEVA